MLYESFSCEPNRFRDACARHGSAPLLFNRLPVHSFGYLIEDILDENPRAAKSWLSVTYFRVHDHVAS